MANQQYDQAQMHELLYQALETERGGIKVYENAVQCAVNADLKKEWQEYLEQTRTHEQVLLNVLEQFGLDATTQTPGRQVVAHLGESLVTAMQMAKAAGDPVGAELVAGECVVLAETKDHLNWELIGYLARGRGKESEILQQAFEAVEQDEDHHLYHTTGWTRELWLDSLGLPAVLPPPEEIRQVESKIGASRAEQSRDQMLKKGH
jgi:hypothetical protein